MSHRRLIAVAVIVAAVIVLSVVAVIAVIIDDVRNPPSSDARMSRTRKDVLASGLTTVRPAVSAQSPKASTSMR